MGAVAVDRRTYIGSADAAAILGISPYRTPLDVYLDKVEGQQPVTPEKAAIFKRGHRLEPYILDMLEEEHQYKLLRFTDENGKTVRSRRHLDPEHSFLAAELDAETVDGKNVEAKSSNFYARKDWGEQHTDAVPVHYNAQAQHAMMVKGSDRTLFPVLIGVDDFRLYEVYRDDDVIKFLRAAELEMWDRIQAKAPPPARTAGDIDRLFPWDHGSVTQATDAIRDSVLALKTLKSKIKLMESDQEDLEERIKVFMGEHAVLKFGSDTLLTWKSQSADRFDSTLFKSKHAAIARKFIKTSTSRVMRIK